MTDDESTDLGWVLDRMPHKAPMLVLDEVRSIEGATIVCGARIRPEHILLDGEGVTPMLAIELFAQAAAALMVYHAAKHRGEMVTGYLLGTRKIELDLDSFRVGDELTIRATELWSAGPLCQLDCTLERDAAVIAKGSINVARG